MSGSEEVCKRDVADRQDKQSAAKENVVPNVSSTQAVSKTKRRRGSRNDHHLTFLPGRVQYYTSLYYRQGGDERRYWLRRAAWKKLDYLKSDFAAACAAQTPSDKGELLQYFCSLKETVMNLSEIIGRLRDCEPRDLFYVPTEELSVCKHIYGFFIEEERIVGVAEIVKMTYATCNAALRMQNAIAANQLRQTTRRRGEEKMAYFPSLSTFISVLEKNYQDYCNTASKFREYITTVTEFQDYKNRVTKHNQNDPCEDKEGEKAVKEDEGAVKEEEILLKEYAKECVNVYNVDHQEWIRGKVVSVYGLPARINATLTVCKQLRELQELIFGAHHATIGSEGAKLKKDNKGWLTVDVDDYLPKVTNGICLLLNTLNNNSHLIDFGLVASINAAVKQWRAALFEIETDANRLGSSWNGGALLRDRQTSLDATATLRQLASQFRQYNKTIFHDTLCFVNAGVSVPFLNKIGVTLNNLNSLKAQVVSASRQASPPSNQLSDVSGSVSKLLTEIQAITAIYEQYADLQTHIVNMITQYSGLLDFDKKCDADADTLAVWVEEIDNTLASLNNFQEMYRGQSDLADKQLPVQVDYAIMGWEQKTEQSTTVVIGQKKLLSLLLDRCSELYFEKDKEEQEALEELGYNENGYDSDSSNDCYRPY